MSLSAFFLEVRALLREPVSVGAAVLRYIVLNWPDTRLGMGLRRRYMALRAGSLGENFAMHRGSDINGYHLVHIGDNSGFGDGVVLALGPGDFKFRMGSRSCLGPGSYVRNANHRFDDPTIPVDDSKPSFLQQGYDGTDVIIGDDVWIGARCILLAGAKIGDHCIIAAGSVVSSEIPANSVAGGNPVRVVRKRLQRAERS